MPISQQLQSIVDSIATLKAGITAQLDQVDQDDMVIIEPLNFCTILSGLPSFRRLPGIPEHMGFDPNYTCDSPENAQELRQYLESVFGIKDADTLNTQRYEFFHTFNEYYDFASEWDGTPTVDVDTLSDDGKLIYTKSRDFAYYFRDLVGQQGFLAWDIGEHVMLIRAAYACGILTQSQYEDMLILEGRQCNEMFANFGDFAISALCGAVYYMFVTAGQFEEDGLAEFLDINMRIVSKLFNDGVWALNAWCEQNYKQLAIPYDQIERLLPDAYLGMNAVASDRILVEGYRISVMLREEPKSPQDTGWRFFAGDEPEDYVTNPANFGILDINLIVNYSADVIPFLEMPVGTLLTRNDDDEFVSYEGEIDLNGESPDDIDPEAFG